MTYRDILVQVDERPGSVGRATLAAQLAARCGAELTGAFLKTDFQRTFMAAEAMAYMSPPDVEGLMQAHSKGVAEAESKARSVFDHAAGPLGLTSDWREIAGDSVADLVGWARNFDLTIIPPQLLASYGQQRISAATIGLASGGPVLVVPDAAAPASVGARVLVAWNGSRESARALRDALPLLADAAKVHVLVVSTDGHGDAETLLLPHLRRHGCDAQLIVERSAHASAGAVIRREVARLDIDLVVMGLYGRSRLQETILGGASQDLIERPPTALLVSH